MAKPIDLEIIILNYNASFWLKKTLKSLDRYYLAKTKYQVKVTVVDNNSSDDSVMVAQDFKFVNLIESKENGGFAKGNNIALKKTKSRYVMLLNSDTQFNDNSNLDLAIKYLEKNKKVGALTPKLILPDGKLDLASHRGEPTLWASFCYFLKLDKLFFHKIPAFNGYHLLHLNLNKTHDVGAISGAAFVLPTKVLKKVGYLDEQFFMYAEDLDWCRRIRNKGFKIKYFPQISIIHHKNKSGIKSLQRGTRKKVNVYFYETMLQYYDKYHQKPIDGIGRFFLNLFIKFKLKIS